MLNQMILTYFLKLKDSNRYHFCRLNVAISQEVTDRANITFANIQEVAYLLSNGVFALTLAHSKGQNQGHANFK